MSVAFLTISDIDKIMRGAKKKFKMPAVIRLADAIFMNLL